MPKKLYATITVAAFALGCPSSSSEPPDAGADAGESDAAIPGQCDPLTDDTCRLHLSERDGACLFRGHATGAVPPIEEALREGGLSVDDVKAAIRFEAALDEVATLADDRAIRRLVTRSFGTDA